MKNKPQSSEKGQTLIILAIGFVVLIGFASLAIDGGMLYADRRQAQNAADAAALAAALAIVNNQDCQTVGLNRADENGYDNNSVTNSVNIHHPPISGQYQDDNHYVQVFITADVNTSFTHFVFQGETKNTVEAIARATPSSTGSLFLGNAIVGLKQGGCGVIKNSGSVSTRVKGGGVWANSDDTKCAFEYNGASGELTVDPPATISVVGKAKYNGGVPNAIVLEWQQQFAYPPLFEIPTPTCNQTAVWDSDNHTLSPGNWTGSFPPDREAYLDPGIYCISSTSFSLNASDIFSGTNVLLYFSNLDAITWNGGATINLSGRDSGDYEGLLMYINHQDYSDPGDCDLTFNGTSDSSFTGTIYAPTCEINILGGGGVEGWRSQIIGYVVKLGGDSTIDIYYEEDDNFITNIPPEIELTK